MENLPSMRRRKIWARRPRESGGQVRRRRKPGKMETEKILQQIREMECER